MASLERTVDVRMEGQKTLEVPGLAGRLWTGVQETNGRASNVKRLQEGGRGTIEVAACQAGISKRK